MAEGAAVTTVNVLGNDSDPDNTLTAASITAFTQGMHGSVVSNNDGTFTYTHDGSETTSDAFTYTIVDGAGGADTATVDRHRHPGQRRAGVLPESRLLRRDRPQRRAGGTDTAPPTVTPVNDAPVFYRNGFFTGCLMRLCNHRRHGSADQRGAGGPRLYRRPQLQRRRHAPLISKQSNGEA